MPRFIDVEFRLEYGEDISQTYEVARRSALRPSSFWSDLITPSGVNAVPHACNFQMELHLDSEEQVLVWARDVQSKFAGVALFHRLS